MLPKEAHGEVDAWMSRHGRSFNALKEVEQTTSGESVPLREAVEIRLDPKMAAMRERAEQALAAPAVGWSIADLDWMPDQAGGYRGVIVLFRSAASAKPVAVLLEVLDVTRPAFARSGDFNISYLSRWGDTECGFDRDLLAACVSALRTPGIIPAADASSAPRASLP
jgi:hypothetical protein